MTERTAIQGLVDRLRAAFDSELTRPLRWRREQLDGLVRLLLEHEHELAAAVAEDLGKPAAETILLETSYAISEARLLRRKLARWTRPRRARLPLELFPGRARVVREPKGVVLVIGPWNYPVQLTLVPLAGALAAGNAVLLKPSELAPATAALLARLLPQYLDPAAVAVVEGGPETAEQLLAERFDHIFFTGGARVARIVARAAAEHLTPVTLELGGKSPAWVDESVDLRVVADRLSWGKFVGAGQTCVAPDYVLAPPAVAERLGAELRAALVRRYGEDPATSPSYGRILDAAKLERLTGMLDAAIADGAELVVGGQADPARRYLAPTVLDGVSLDAELMAEEIFGPILPIIRVADAETAIEIVRAGEKPLALYVFTRRRAVRRAFLARTSSGSLGVNVPVAQLAARSLPFGGVGASGIGAYHGEHSIRTFSHERGVLTKPLRPDTVGLVYPPYGRRTEAVDRYLLR